MAPTQPVLALENGAQGPSFRRDDLNIDALPYIDPLEPALKAEVDRLIAEEARRSTKPLGEYYRELAAPPLKFEGHPLLAAEYTRCVAVRRVASPCNKCGACQLHASAAGRRMRPHGHALLRPSPYVACYSLCSVPASSVAQQVAIVAAVQHVGMMLWSATALHDPDSTVRWPCFQIYASRCFSLSTNVKPAQKHRCYIEEPNRSFHAVPLHAN